MFLPRIVIHNRLVETRNYNFKLKNNIFLILYIYKRHISRCDEIGRRARLKIWCGSPHVPVRLRPSAFLTPAREFFSGVEPPVLTSHKT